MAGRDETLAILTSNQQLYVLGNCSNNYCGQGCMSLNNLHFDTFTMIPLESPFTRIEADDYGISLYINNTITRTGVDNGQFCDGRPNGALTCVGNGTGFLQFASDMAYLVMMDTMYLCYNRQNSSYRRYVDGLALDSEGYVQTIRNGSYAISAKPMRHRVVWEARLQASQKNVFIICPGCTHVEEEESRDDGGDDVQNDPSMPVWEIVLIAVASVAAAASLGVLVWYLVSKKTHKRQELLGPN